MEEDGVRPDAVTLKTLISNEQMSLAWWLWDHHKANIRPSARTWKKLFEEATINRRIDRAIGLLDTYLSRGLNPDPYYLNVGGCVRTPFRNGID